MRSATCRTLISVFDRLRSISFCRLRTRSWSPARVAAKIRCRSRRTRSSAARQSTAFHPRSSSLGPFAPTPALGHGHRRRPSVQLVPRFQRLVVRSLRRSTRSMSALFRGGPLGPVSGRLYDTTAMEERSSHAAFPSPFGAPVFASWTILFPLRHYAFLAVGLPATGWTATGFPRCTRMRCDRSGRLLDPGADGVHPAGKEYPRRHPPLSSGQALYPHHSRHPRGPDSHEASTKVQRRMPRRGQATRTLARDHVPGISRTSNQRDPLTTCTFRVAPPPCGVPVVVLLFSPSSVKIPAFKNALTSAETRLSFTRQRTRSIRAVMVNPVEARLDVRIQHPPIASGAEMVDLSDRILSTPVGPEPIGDRLEVGLEDRFQHKFQPGLHDPVGHRRNPEGGPFLTHPVWESYVPAPAKAGTNHPAGKFAGRPGNPEHRCAPRRR
ncbi:hypothetical protein B0I32_1662 [Nonomuraea fuscirosea]|uniref:Uncharacterized protein n=1 Tax=Nonomuraea fuscirosea TaxID=1291556 RepID=A0A2T0LJY7_9ACTN|nr:hypothetical protein B0I32_1662 [Nonomuraea fuscirosea]